MRGAGRGVHFSLSHTHNRIIHNTLAAPVVAIGHCVFDSRMSELRDSVTCLPTQVNAPCLNRSNCQQVSWYSIYPPQEGWKAELT